MAPAGLSRCSRSIAGEGLRREPGREPAGDADLRLRPVPRRVLLPWDRKTLTYPWKNGLKADEIQAYYDEGANFADEKPYKDWMHAESGAPVLKERHPEFEPWNQGIHARSGWRARTATCPTSARVRSR